MITLKTLPQATAQEVFDQIAVHLLKQNRASAFSGSCFYRSFDGLRCAAGCLMSDEEYKKDFERKDWRTLANNNIVPSNHEELIISLQIIHDDFDPLEWKKHLKNIAKIHGLNTTAIEKF